ncbi:hypothetical protein E308F_30720 [Moorella sp. E308F]|uniref:hypothetical protein n=1 Tax=Moorella sp. E308F TaxID=2572682 RepID=UPI0010FFAE3D|nr:hypothetical protein [Moorella sp. E308F]GEA16826.1 hypothetical protein E308F_30720 [Moorella sp. E308F]
MSMKNLADSIFQETVPELNKELLQEYYERSQRQKEDKKWLEKYKPIIIQSLQNAGKNKLEQEGFRVSITIPNTSHFDMEKVLVFLKEKQLGCLKEVVDEEALTQAIEEGVIDLEELKAVAWIEDKGTPRLTIKKVSSDD